MAGISSLGVGSGLDLSKLLTQLESAERTKLSPLVAQKTTNDNKISAFGSLKSVLSKLQSAAEVLSKPDAFQKQSSSITGSAIKTVVGDDAVVGSYQINVSQMARAQSLVANGVASRDKAMDITAGKMSISLGSESALGDGSAKALEVNIAEGSSLEAMRDAINAQARKDGVGVTASIINAGGDTPYRLVINSNTTGTDSQLNVSFSGGGADAAHFQYDSVTHTGAMTQTIAAKNAELTVNGVSITSQTNTVDGAMQGVTLTLSGEGVTETLSVSRDDAGIKNALNNFVAAYNDLNKTISSLSSYDATSKTGGTLLGDSTLRNVQNAVRNVMTGSVSGGLERLSNAGIALQLDGTLKVDDTRLNKVMANDFNALTDFFAGAAGDDKGGFADKVKTALDDILSDKGILKNATDGLNTHNKELSDRYDRMEKSIDATILRYQAQFAQLDKVVSQMNSTSSYLTQQFDAINAQMKAR